MLPVSDKLRGVLGARIASSGNGVAAAAAAAGGGSGGARPCPVQPRRALFFRRAGGLTQEQDLLPPSSSPLLGDANPSGGIKHYFLTGLSVASQEQLQHLVSPGRFAFSSAPSLTSMPWLACARPLATKNCRPACSGLSVPLPVPARQRLPLMPDYSPLLGGGTG